MSMLPRPIEPAFHAALAETLLAGRVVAVVDDYARPISIAELAGLIVADPRGSSFGSLFMVRPGDLVLLKESFSLAYGRIALVIDNTVDARLKRARKELADLQAQGAAELAELLAELSKIIASQKSSVTHVVHLNGGGSAVIAPGAHAAWLGDRLFFVRDRKIVAEFARSTVNGFTALPAGCATPATITAAGECPAGFKPDAAPMPDASQVA